MSLVISTQENNVKVNNIINFNLIGAGFQWKRLYISLFIMNISCFMQSWQYNVSYSFFMDFEHINMEENDAELDLKLFCKIHYTTAKWTYSYLLSFY